MMLDQLSTHAMAQSDPDNSVASQPKYMPCTAMYVELTSHRVVFVTASRTVTKLIPCPTRRVTQ